MGLSGDIEAARRYLARVRRMDPPEDVLALVEREERNLDQEEQAMKAGDVISDYSTVFDLPVGTVLVEGYGVTTPAPHLPPEYAVPVVWHRYPEDDKEGDWRGIGRGRDNGTGIDLPATILAIPESPSGKED